MSSSRTLPWERGLRRDRVRARRHEAQPDRDAVDVGVDREVRPIQREEQHARRGLRSHAREGDERLPEILIRHRRECTVVQRHAAVSDPAQHRADPHGLRRTETATTNGACERGQRSVGDLVPGREPPAKVGVRAVAVGIARVLREHRQDELLERREVARFWRRAVGAREAFRDGA
jgi:hypothetical protein